MAKDIVLCARRTTSGFQVQLGNQEQGGMRRRFPALREVTGETPAPL
jgi:hypothetical protein